MRSATVLLALEIGCGAPIRSRELPPIEPANLIDADTYTTRVAGLRATLARSNVTLDTQPVIRTCASHHGSDDCVRCDVASRGDTANVDPEMIDAVAIAFARYPTSVIVATKLAHVALCRQIRNERNPSETAPAGVALLGADRMLISIEHFVGKTHGIDDYFTIEQVVHHELFHLFDHATRGTLINGDREWHALNPPGFEYRVPGASERPAGFVNAYATTTEVEDRASVFEYLMGQPTKLCTIAGVDPIVAAKTAVVWKRVAKVMGAALLRRHAPCVDWIDRKRPKVKPAQPTKSRPGVPTTLHPRKPSIWRR